MNNQYLEKTDAYMILLKTYLFYMFSIHKKIASL